MKREPNGADAPDALLTDREAARALRVGNTAFFQLQKQEGFPPPIWLGPRTKRHSRNALLAWALSRTQRPDDWRERQQRTIRAACEGLRAHREARRAARRAPEGADAAP